MRKLLAWMLLTAAAACLAYAAVNLPSGDGTWRRLTAISAYVLFGGLMIGGVSLLLQHRPDSSSPGEMPDHSSSRDEENPNPISHS